MAEINFDENSVPSEDGGTQAGNTFQCACCPSRLTSQSIYGQHIRNSHANKTAADFNGIGTITNFVDCPTCHLIYVGTRGIQKHTCNPQQAVIRRNLLNLQAATVAAAGGGLALAAAAAPPIPVDETFNDETLNDLMSMLQHGLYYLHKTWKGLLGQLVVRCLNEVCDGDDLRAKWAMTALLILPGIISEMRKGKSAPVTFLREALAAADSVICILTKGAGIMAIKAANAPNGVPARHTPTQEDLLKTTEKLVLMERFSSAIHCMDQVASLETGEQLDVERLSLEAARAQLLTLNPPATDADIIPGDGSDDPDALTLTVGDIELGIRQLQRGSSNGSSGWTNALIQSVCFAATDTTLCTTITRFFNKCLQGTLKASCREFWTVSRAVLLAKKGGGWRPLGIGESWYRLLGRIVSKKVSATIGEQLRPIQLACGTRGGCEIAGRLGQMVLTANSYDLVAEDLSIATLDIRNAFNTLRRGMVWEGILKYCPKLAKWFRSFYGGPSGLRLSSGDWVGQSCTGVKQGDPLAFAFFCMGMQRPLLELQAELSSRLLPGHVGGVWAYADDTSFFGPTAVVRALCHKAVDILASHDLEVVVRKCSIVGRNVGNRQTNLFAVAPEGLVLMGNPIGSIEYRRQQCDAMVDEMIRPLPQLQKLHSHSAFTLLHFCINARPGYLARVAEPEAAGGALRRFDTAVDHVVTDLCGGGTPSMRVKVLRELPQSLGGLGLTRYEGIGGSQACLSSRLLCKEFLENHFRGLLASTNYWAPLALEQRVTELDHQLGEAHTQDQDGAGAGAGAAAEDPPRAPVTLQKIKSTAFYEKRNMQQTLLAELLEEGQRAAASWLLSGSTPSAGRWLHARGGAFRQHELSSQEFIDVLRLRLLLPPREDVMILNQYCTCHTHVNLAERPFHFLACDLNRALTVARHNAVRDCLVKLVKQCHPGAVVGTETELPGGALKMDIQYTVGHEAKFIDVMVVHPGAHTYLERGSALVEDVANKAGEQVKRTKYSVVPHLQEHGNFVPFVVEATGRLGPSAMTWLRHLTAGRDVFFRSRCLTTISAYIAMYNAKMIGAARARCVGE